MYALSFLVAASLGWHLPRERDGHLETVGRIAMAMVALGAFGFVFLVFKSKRPMAGTIHRSQSLPVFGVLPHRVLIQLRFFQDRPKSIALALLMSLAAQCLMVLSIYTIAIALYSDPRPPTLVEHFTIIPVSLLAAALPLTPAGLGIFEVSLGWMYGLFSASESISGVLVGLVFEFVKVIMALVGVLFYWTSGSEIKCAPSGDPPKTLMSG